MDTLQLNINMIESYNIAKIKTVIKHHDDTLWNTDLENKSTLTLYREHKRKIHEEQQSYDNTSAITTLFEARKTLQKSDSLQMIAYYIDNLKIIMTKLSCKET